MALPISLLTVVALFASQGALSAADGHAMNDSNMTASVNDSHITTVMPSTAAPTVEVVANPTPATTANATMNTTLVTTVVAVATTVEVTTVMPSVNTTLVTTSAPTPAPSAPTPAPTPAPAAPTPASPAPQPTIVTGSMGMTVSDPEAFVNDPTAKAAVSEGLAAHLGVPKSYVNVELSIPVSRRLAMPAAGRRLESGSVKVDYTVTIPPNPTSDLGAPITASSISSTLQRASEDTSAMEALSAKITEKVTAALPNITVSVDSVAAPAITVATPAPATTEEPTVDASPKKAVPGILLAVAVLLVNYGK